VNVRRGKVSSYGEGLREKQKVQGASMACMKNSSAAISHWRPARQGQHRRNADDALRTPVSTIVVFKLGWAVGPAREARQVVIVHGHINVNGKRVNVPSYSISKDDEIKARPNGQSQKRVKCAFRRKPRGVNARPGSWPTPMEWAPK